MGKTRNTGFSNNAIQYNSGSIAFVSGSTTLLNISSSGNIVTTGTITAQTLVVQTVTSSISFVTGSTKFGVLSSNTHQFTGSLNVTGALYVATGSVGIGTVSPSQLFEVVGGEIKAGRVDSSNEGGQVSFGRSTDNATAWYIDAYGNVASPQLRFVNVSDAVVAMTITGSNVGIGLTPSYALDVANSSSPSIRVRNGGLGGTATLLLETANDFSGTCQTYVRCIGSTGNGTSTLTFGTAGGTSDQTATERMRITSGGDVLVGSTGSPYVGANRGNIFLNGASQSLYGFGIAGAARGYMYHGGTQLYFENSASGGNLYMVAGSAGVVLNNGATSWTGNSDERLKDINSNIENALDKLITLRAVNFSWKSDKEKKENLGLIAQDVEKVFPQVVDKYTLPVKLDDENPDETEYLGVRYTEMIPVLVKAIQELKAENDALKTRIETLENK
jgi:hypothetical protein